MVLIESIKKAVTNNQRHDSQTVLLFIDIYKSAREKKKAVQKKSSKRNDWNTQLGTKKKFELDSGLDRTVLHCTGVKFLFYIFFNGKKPQTNDELKCVR